MERYEVSSWFASWNVDDYEKGEQLEGYENSGGADWHRHTDTLPDLIEQLMDFAGTTDPTAVNIFREDDGAGRIDIQTWEDENHMVPTPAQIEAWKRGEKKLYNGYYIFLVDHVKRDRVTADELVAGLPTYSEV